MRRAAFYIYWNLHKECWSIKHKGRLWTHVSKDALLACHDCAFSVSEKGRQRVIKNRRKNVHAYVRCDWYEVVEKINTVFLRQITYNPYRDTGFVYTNTLAPCEQKYPCLLLRNKAVYIY